MTSTATTETVLLAYATIAGNDIGADPNITILEQAVECHDGQPHTEPAEVLQWTTEDDDWAASADGDFDRDVATGTLNDLGYARVGGWMGSGCQWAARVIPA